MRAYQDKGLVVLGFPRTIFRRKAAATKKSPHFARTPLACAFPCSPKQRDGPAGQRPVPATGPADRSGAALELPQIPDRPRWNRRRQLFQPDQPRQPQRRAPSNSSSHAPFQGASHETSRSSHSIACRGWNFRKRTPLYAEPGCQTCPSFSVLRSLSAPRVPTETRGASPPSLFFVSGRFATFFSRRS